MNRSEEQKTAYLQDNEKPLHEFFTGLPIRPRGQLSPGCGTEAIAMNKGSRQPPTQNPQYKIQKRRILKKNAFSALVERQYKEFCFFETHAYLPL